MTFTELCARSRESKVPAIDVRFELRARIQRELEQEPRSWTDALSVWTGLRSIRVGFVAALVCTSFSAYWELSRPGIAQEPAPPLPPFVTQALIGE